MPEYRRLRVSGGTYFFTANLADRQSTLLVDEIDALRAAVRRARAAAPFHIDAWTVLPDHMHCVWTLPDGDDNFPARWHAIKAFFSAALPDNEHRSASRASRGERGIWQRRYWEHLIRDDDDYRIHMDYTHFNAVNTASSKTLRIGCIRPFTVTPPRAYTPPAGSAPPTRPTPANAHKP